MPVLPIADIRVDWPSGRQPGWSSTLNGLQGGQFGQIEHRAIGQFGPDGQFQALFDRPVVVEGPHAIAIAFGRDIVDGKFKIGLVKEQRDTAAKSDGKSTLFFWGPPRGFAEPTDKGPIQMAVRETGEETGAGVLAGEPWVIGNFITNETCTASWSPIVAVPLNLARLSEIQKEDGRGEKILKAQFFTLNQIESMIRDTTYDDALTTSMVLGQIALLYRLHLKNIETMHPENLWPSYCGAWYP